MQYCLYYAQKKELARFKSRCGYILFMDKKSCQAVECCREKGIFTTVMMCPVVRIQEAGLCVVFWQFMKTVILEPDR